MANTPTTALRLPPELVAEARARVGSPDVALSVLVRAGLAMVAGYALKDALASAETRRGPKPRTGKVA